MSKANPEKAVRAILPAPITCPCGCVVRPLTLGMFAVLERIHSPLLGETPADGALSLVPSLYALTHEPADALAGDLFGRSLAWADTLPPAALAEIKDAAERQVAAMLAVVPEPPPSKKKATTDGSPSSPNGPRTNTAGRSTKSSGGPRPRRSPSSAAREARPRAPVPSSHSA